MKLSLAQEFESSDVVPDRKWWQSTLMVCGVLCACTLISVCVARYLDHENVIMIYLLGVVWIASKCGFRAALAACMLSVVSYDWYVVPPHFSILPSDPQLIFTFVIMIVVAVVLARVTDSLRVQAKLRGQQAELLDTTNDAIFVWSLRDNKIAYWNTGAEKMFGITRQAAIGQSTLNLLHGNYREPHEKLLSQLLDKKQWNGEVEYRHADGSPVVVASRLMIKNGRDQQPEAVVEFATDIRERKLAETRIKEFYSVVSHELRTPLTAVFGSLRLLEAGTVIHDPATTQELLKISINEIQKVIVLINDILDLQKIESGMLEIHKQPMSANALAETTVRSLQVLADEAKVRFACTTLSPDVTFLADYNRLLQVTTNLAVNAIKFTPSFGEVTISVEKVEPELIRFSVTDTGCGIDEKLFPKLFQKFQQLDSSDSRQYGGTGLGLAISKSLVDQHGGTISVKSVVGQGTTFWFDIPLNADPKTESGLNPLPVESTRL